MMVSGAIIFKIAGTALASEFVAYVMSIYGHGDKVGFVRVVTYLVCGSMALNELKHAIDFVQMTFGGMRLNF